MLRGRSDDRTLSNLGLFERLDSRMEQNHTATASPPLPTLFESPASTHYKRNALSGGRSLPAGLSIF